MAALSADVNSFKSIICTSNIVARLYFLVKSREMFSYSSRRTMLLVLTVTFYFLPETQRPAPFVLTYWQNRLSLQRIAAVLCSVVSRDSRSHGSNLRPFISFIIYETMIERTGTSEVIDICKGRAGHRYLDRRCCVRGPGIVL